MARSGTLEPPPGRGALLALGLGAVVVLQYGLRWPFGWAILGGLPFVAVFLAAPWLARRSLQAFDRDAMVYLARGQAGRLPGRYRRAWGLRWLAPTPLRDERRGLALAEAGSGSEALRAYRGAVAAYDDMGVRPTPGAVHGWARLASEQDRPEEAVVAWRRLRSLGASVPELDQRLAEAEARLSEPSPSSAPGRAAAPVESVPPRPAER